MNEHGINSNSGAIIPATGFMSVLSQHGLPIPKYRTTQAAVAGK